MNFMKNKIKKGLITLLLSSFLLNLLFFSEESIILASEGLLIWYKNMIPTLFPFMVLSGFLVQTGMAAQLSKVFYPILKHFFPVTPPMLYGIIMGFLCGFPMGAKVVADLLENRQITSRQGEYLLAFCNNIGPLYLLGYVIPLFNWKSPSPVLLLMYGVPLLYGCFLPFFGKYKVLKKELEYAQGGKRYEVRAAQYTDKASLSKAGAVPRPSYGLSFQNSLENALHQITMLGGCMVFFNCLLIYPKLLADILAFTPLRTIYENYLYGPFCCLIEIGGGLRVLSTAPLAYQAPTFLTFGGLCCIMQTCFILQGTKLKLSAYTGHKLIQSMIIFFLILFYALVVK